MNCLFFINISYRISAIGPSIRYDLIIERDSNLSIKGFNSHIENNLKKPLTAEATQRNLIINNKYTEPFKQQKVASLENEENEIDKAAAKLPDFVKAYKQRIEQYDQWKHKIPFIPIKRKKTRGQKNRFMLLKEVCKFKNELDKNKLNAAKREMFSSYALSKKKVQLIDPRTTQKNFFVAIIGKNNSNTKISL